MAQNKKPFDAISHFDKSLSEIYDRKIRLLCPSYDALHEMIVPWLYHLPEQSNFLSVGAGTGAEIVTLGKRFPLWCFTAVDVSSDMLNACKKRVVEVGMAERVSFVNGHLKEYQSLAPFDAASSIFVSHFIKGRKEKLEYFRSIAAALEPGGLFILADLFGDKTAPAFERLLNTWLVSYALRGISTEELTQDRAHIDRDVSIVPEVELFALLNEAGFDTPIRFYQTFLFGGWVVAKHV